MIFKISRIAPIFLVCLTLRCTSIIAQQPTVVSYTGKAIDQKTKEPLFIAKFSEKRINGELQSVETTYFNTTGKEQIATRKVVFKSAAYCPNVVFQNLRNGSTEIITVNGKTAEIYYKKNEATDAAKKSLSNMPGPIVADAGLVALILDKWDLLLSGKKQELSIIVPSRLDYYSFYLKNKPSQNKDLIDIYFESNHWFIRQVVSPIILSFDPKTKRLMRYEGTTNLSDANGELIMKAIITYQFDK